MNNHEKIWLSILKEREMTPNELNILDSELVCPITDFAILQVTGNDRYEFLQNQLTGDLNKSKASSNLHNPLLEVKAEFSSWCNLKGRVIANFLILNTTESYLLVLKKDMADYVLKKLKMYILRSDVKINDITEEMLLVGLANFEVNLGSPLVSTGSPREDGGVIDLRARSDYGDRPGYLIKLPDFSNRFLAITHVTQMKGILYRIECCEDKIVNFKIWNKLDILAGFAWIDFKNKEKFLPQMLNLDKFGAVSFSKGCYVGQEVIARLHHRGKVKRTMKLISSIHELCPGSHLYVEDSTRKVGDILNSSTNRSEKDFFGLAIIESEKLNNNLYIDTLTKKRVYIIK